MLPQIDRMLDTYDRGGLSRRTLILQLTGLLGAAAGVRAAQDRPTPAATFNATQINHVDRDRSVQLNVGSTADVPLADLIRSIETTVQPVRDHLPLGYAIELGGQADDLLRTWLAFRGALLLSLLVTWGPCAPCIDCPADFDHNCTVGASDLLTLVVNWGPCP